MLLYNGGTEGTEKHGDAEHDLGVFLRASKIFLHQLAHGDTWMAGSSPAMTK
jgi:hypothetical protein